MIIQPFAEHRHYHQRLELVELDRSIDYRLEVLATSIVVIGAPLLLFIIGACFD